MVPPMQTDAQTCRRRTGLGRLALLGWLVWGNFGAAVRAEENVYLTGVPDYEWYSGCFGTATGNLIGFWDRHGCANFYTGPTADGVAPLNSYGANYGIRSLWVSRAGRDGRPANQLGHEEDYYVSYDSPAADPYRQAGRPEHAPDCIGDFIGLNQRKWVDLNGECDGNVDGFSFVYWDATGKRRVNYTPDSTAGEPPVDIQSGLRAWAEYRGYAADTFTQLSEFNPRMTGPAPGFTFEDLKAEIDRGYPVLVFLQDWNRTSRTVAGVPHLNPEIHGMLAIGYNVDDDGNRFVRIRDSWATSESYPLREWGPVDWAPVIPGFLPVRGVIGFHPKPRILSLIPQGDQLTIRWEGPDAEVYDGAANTTRKAHWYVLEQATSLATLDFAPILPPTTARELTVSGCCAGPAFFRLQVVASPD